MPQHHDALNARDTVPYETKNGLLQLLRWRRGTQRTTHRRLVCGPKESAERDVPSALPSPPLAETASSSGAGGDACPASSVVETLLEASAPAPPPPSFALEPEQFERDRRDEVRVLSLPAAAEAAMRRTCDATESHDVG